MLAAAAAAAAAAAMASASMEGAAGRVESSGRLSWRGEPRSPDMAADSSGQDRHAMGSTSIGTAGSSVGCPSPPPAAAAAAVGAAPAAPALVNVQRPPSICLLLLLAPAAAAVPLLCADADLGLSAPCDMLLLPPLKPEGWGRLVLVSPATAVRPLGVTRNFMPASLLLPACWGLSGLCGSSKPPGCGWSWWLCWGLLLPPAAASRWASGLAAGWGSAVAAAVADVTADRAAASCAAAVLGEAAGAPNCAGNLAACVGS
jgi:hypothetical protein